MGRQEMEQYLSSNRRHLILEKIIYFGEIAHEIELFWKFGNWGIEGLIATYGRKH